MRSLLFSSIALAAVAGGAARAEEAIIPDNEDAYVVDSPDPDALPPPDGFDYPTRVYGWTALRPLNCGTFRYWNGEYCADARTEPSRE
jgi:hypothetical protein